MRRLSKLLLGPSTPENVVDAEPLDLAPGTILLGGQGRGYWQRACILLVEHSATGSVGLLLSRSTSFRKPAGLLRDVCALHRTPLEAGGILSGGPVGFAPHVLHDRRRVADARKIGEGVYVGGALDALVAACGDNDSSSESDDDEEEETVTDSEEEQKHSIRKPVRAFHGCAVWGVNQLEAEVRRETWRVVPCAALRGESLARLVFREPPAQCWEAASRLVEVRLPASCGEPALERPDFSEAGRLLLGQIRSSDHRSDYRLMDLIYHDPQTHGKIYVGNETSARQADRHAEKITHVVNCTDDLGNYCATNPGMSYLRFNVSYWMSCGESRSTTRKSDADIVDWLYASVFAFVDAALAKGENVLVHCLAGAHRAGTTGILLLMYKVGLGAVEATAAAKESPFGHQPHL